MGTIRSSDLLRRVLLLDAAASGATGLLAALGAGVLAPVLGLPDPLLRWAGLTLLPFAAVVGALGLRPAVPAVALWAVVVANALWTVDSLLLLVVGGLAPTAFGTVFVTGQAALVGAFAGLQFLGLRRSMPTKALVGSHGV